MKKIFLLFLATLISCTAQAQEAITVVNAQGPTQTQTAQIVRTIEEANRIQNRYRFVMMFKPGGFESIGIKEALQNPSTHVVTVTNTMIEGHLRGLHDLKALAPVFSYGEACWVVITAFGNQATGLDSIRKFPPKEILGGTPAPGGSVHLAALDIGKKYNIPTRLIMYKSSTDALIEMTGRASEVNFTMDRVINFQQFSERNKNLQALAVTCSERHPSLPNVKTLKEQGIGSPAIFQYMMASTEMPEARRQDIENIFVQAAKTLGRERMQALSEFVSPVFLNQSSWAHYEKTVSNILDYRKRYAKEIAESQ